MFRSNSRAIVYPQAVHARLAATIAAAWGNERFERPSLPFESFVQGVALHDRGYGELDSDDPRDMQPDAWVDIQRRSFAPRGEDPVVDLVVAMHIRRLVSTASNAAEIEALREIEEELPRLRDAAGVSEAEALAANDITLVCDRISLELCVEVPRSWSYEVLPMADAEPIELAHSHDGEGHVTLRPWPLAVPWLTGIVGGFRLDGYPDRLEPVIRTFRIVPA